MGHPVINYNLILGEVGGIGLSGARRPDPAGERGRPQPVEAGRGRRRPQERRFRRHPPHAAEVQDFRRLRRLKRLKGQGVTCMRDTRDAEIGEMKFKEATT